MRRWYPKQEKITVTGKGKVKICTVPGLVPEYKVEWQKLFLCNEWTDRASDR